MSTMGDSLIGRALGLAAAAGLVLTVAQYPTTARAQPAAVDVKVDGKRITMAAAAAPLDTLLQRVGAAADFTVDVSCRLGCPSFSGSWSGTIEELLPQFLGKLNYLVVYQENDGAAKAKKVSHVIVLSRLETHTAETPEKDNSESGAEDSKSRVAALMREQRQLTRDLAKAQRQLAERRENAKAPQILTKQLAEATAARERLESELKRVKQELTTVKILAEAGPAAGSVSTESLVDAPPRKQLSPTAPIRPQATPVEMQAAADKATAATTPEMSARPGAQAAPSVVLVGLVIEDNRKLAVVQRLQTHAVVRLMVDQEIDGWQVREIRTDGVLFERGGVVTLMPPREGTTVADMRGLSDIANPPAPQRGTGTATPASKDSAAAAAGDTVTTPPQKRLHQAKFYRVQLASVRTEKGAQIEWQRLQRLYGAILNDEKKLTVARADLGAMGIYHRLQIGPFSSHEKASALCAVIRSRNGACLIVRP